MSKSKEIRKVARQMVHEGKPPRPKEIVARLKAKGINVYSSQVSTALRGTDFALRKPLPPNDHTDMPPFEDVRKARDFVRSIGSLERAMNAISAFGLFKQEQDRETEQYYGGA